MGVQTFSHPAPQGPGHAVIPFFLPYSGCPSRCVYCSQSVQTGVQTHSLEHHFRLFVNRLEQLGAEIPKEIGFYGGTFTNLPEQWVERFLRKAAQAKAKGMLVKARCSTRPDMLTQPQLERLKALGLDMIELGIQSFDDTSLRTSRRDYTGEVARRACAMVRESGLDLGIQLMPGIPGSSPASFLADIETTLAMSPSQVRLYPCQVLSATRLEDMWRDGAYTPWPLDSTIVLLVLAVSRLWSRSIRVIRMGLSPEQSLEAARLAGPWHPALGFLVRSRVLAAHIGCLLSAMPNRAYTLLVPERYLSEVMGHKGDRLPLLQRMGLSRSNIRSHSGELFYLYSNECVESELSC